MLRKIFLLLILILVSVPSQVLATYDPLSVPNNKFGIHVLSTAEVDKAAQLVNSAGGDWGYVTIPIPANERNLEKWAAFMKDCQNKHLIPILRIATFAVGDHWMAPNEWDLVDFANFLDQLPWPTENRYVVIYNEPNHDSEWGGFVYPSEYARVLDRAIDIFHKKNPDFYVISAGLDSAAPNGENSMNEYEYLRQMNQANPDIFRRIDGFSSHAYGNPGFITYPNIWSPMSVANYRFEENYLETLGAAKPKIFVTEAGFRNDLLGDNQATSYWNLSWVQVWTDDNLVAITPFLLSADAGPFVGFSFTNEAGEFRPFAKSLAARQKIKGSPRLKKYPREMTDFFIPTVLGNLINNYSLPVSLQIGTKFDYFGQIRRWLLSLWNG